MMIHGDRGKQADYGLWMATERSKEFGNSKFREVHCGHRHKLAVDEKLASELEHSALSAHRTSAF